MLTKDGGAYSVPLRFRLTLIALVISSAQRRALGAESVFFFFWRHRDPHISSNESRSCLCVYGVAVPFEAASSIAAAILASPATPGCFRTRREEAPLTSGMCRGFNWTPFPSRHRSQSASRQKPLTLQGPVIPAKSCRRCWVLLPVLSMHVHGRIH